MVNQYTATIIVGVLSVIGALVSVTIGAMLSTRQTLKQEEIKSRQEKAKRNNEIIEEIYQRFLDADDLCEKLYFDVQRLDDPDFDVVGRIKQIATALNRPTTLTRLYLPSLKEELAKHLKNTTNYWNIMEVYYSTKKLKSIQNLHGRLREARETYKANFNSLQRELEKLVK